jgi:hypothetical protein
VPGAGDDPVTKTAVEEFDQAQSDAAGAVPSNRTSKGLEDKLDEATQKKDEVDANPNSTAKQKEAAQAVRDKAEEDADDFNEGTMDPDVAENYREKLEKRREARAKLEEEKRRWLRARHIPRKAARALRLINSRLELANEPPPSTEELGLVPSEGQAPHSDPSIADLRSVREDLTRSSERPSVYVPYDSNPDASGEGARRDSARLLNSLVVQRAQEKKPAHRGDRERPIHERSEPSAQADRAPRQRTLRVPVEELGYERR